MDRRVLGVERAFVERSLARWVLAGDREPTAGERLKYQERSRRALRCMILRTSLPGIQLPAGRQPALPMVLPGRCAE